MDSHILPPPNNPMPSGSDFWYGICHKESGASLYFGVAPQNPEDFKFLEKQGVSVIHFFQHGGKTTNFENPTSIVVNTQKALKSNATEISKRAYSFAVECKKTLMYGNSVFICDNDDKNVPSVIYIIYCLTMLLERKTWEFCLRFVRDTMGTTSRSRNRRNPILIDHYKICQQYLQSAIGIVKNEYGKVREFETDKVKDYDPDSELMRFESLSFMLHKFIISSSDLEKGDRNLYDFVRNGYDWILKTFDEPDYVARNCYIYDEEKGKLFYDDRNYTSRFEI